VSTWDRDDKEPIVWFNRFEVYRTLGPTRSLVKAENRERLRGINGAQKRPTGQASGQWKRAYEKWHWKARAEAWDESEITRARQEWDDERKSEKKERIQLWRAYRAKLMQGLANIDPNRATWYDITNGLRTACEMLMLDYGEMNSQGAQLDGAGQRIPIREVVVHLPAETLDRIEMAEIPHTNGTNGTNGR
jgi:hypothetical protein